MKFIKRSKSNKRNDPFSISISDLMAGILMIFILALISMFFINKSENERNNHQVEQRKEILEFMQDMPEAKSGKITIDAENGVILITTNDSGGKNHEKTPIFESGESKLTPEGERLIKTIAAKIDDSKNKKQEAWQSIDTIIIEGHTDNVQYNDPTSDKNNLKLSVDRAIATYKVTLSTLSLNPDNPNQDITNVTNSNIVKKWKNTDDQFIFSVAGYGESRLINKAAPSSAENRRIEFRFLLKHHKIKDLK